MRQELQFISSKDFLFGKLPDLSRKANARTIIIEHEFGIVVVVVVVVVGVVIVVVGVVVVATLVHITQSLRMDCFISLYTTLDTTTKAITYELKITSLKRRQFKAIYSKNGMMIYYKWQIP